MEYTFSNEDIEKIKKFIEVKNRGYYADGGQVTDVYNRVLHKNANPTNCGSCIRQRIQEMENALRHYQAKEAAIKAQEEQNKDKVDNIPSGENKVSEEPKKRVGRPPKKS